MTRLLRSILVLCLLGMGAACSPPPDTPAEGEMPPAPPPAQIEPGVPGEGAATGEMCGGIAGISCAAPTDFCQYPTGQCRMPDAAGTCTAKAEICTMEYDPVCGCDGKTYSNACSAGSAGVSVMSQGACEADMGEE